MNFDLELLIAYTVVVGMTKSRDAHLALFGFVFSFAYTSSAAYEIHPAYINHLVISMCFVPFVIFMRKPCAVATLVYMIYHWIVSGDHLFYQYQDWISNSFLVVATSLNGLIMAAIIYDRLISDYHVNADMGSGWIADFIRNTRLAKKMEGREKC